MSTAILFLQIIATLFFTSVIHEGGHYLACRYYKIPVLQVMIFSGTPKYSLHFGIKDTQVLIGWLPYGGYVATPGGIDLRKQYIILLSGPAANFLVSVGLFFTHNKTVLHFFFVYNLVMFISTMLPFTKNKDGYRLLQILKQWYRSRKQCK